MRCILDEGFEAASARHIAERAGVTWGVIQYHFGDREALMMAVVDEGYAHLLEALRTPPDALANMNARKRIEAIVSASGRRFRPRLRWPRWRF